MEPRRENFADKDSMEKYVDKDTIAKNPLLPITMEDFPKN